jgi:anti-sigma regulatory factor (Ser/Thr protein kinase)
MTLQMQPPPSVTVRVFTQRLSATRRGARLARLMTQRELDVWRIPYRSRLSESAALVVAELAANAVTHGRVPGRDFELSLTLTAERLHIDVSDTRTDAAPPPPGDVPAPGPLSESGRGLLVVGALCERWGVSARTPAPGKTVWAELSLR